MFFRGLGTFKNYDVFLMGVGKDGGFEGKKTERASACPNHRCSYSQHYLAMREA